MNGRRFWLVGMAMVIVGMSWASASPAAQSTPTSTVDPLQITATRIVERATMTGAANQLATHQALFAALTAIPDIHATTMAADPLNITATAIIARATQTAGANLTATQESLIALTATLTPYEDDPLNITATAIIARATQTAAVNLTATYETAFGTGPAPQMPTPTLTALEVQSLRERWLTEMQDAAGFEHPIFNMLANEFMNSIYIERRSIGREYEPVSQVERTTYEGETYVVMLIDRSELLWDGHRLLAFRVTDDGISLIPDPIQTQPVGNIMALGDGFADRNGNGYPDLAIGTNSGGSSPTIVLVLLEISPDGEIVDITPEITYAYPWSLVDLDGDGILEIEARGCIPHPFNFSCPDRYTGLVRYYAWDGTAYRDISSTEEAYLPVINAYWEAASQFEGCLLPDNAMYDMLVAYLVLGRLEEGWTQLLPRLHWERCSFEVREVHGQEMIDLIAWVGRHLEDESQP